MSIAALHEIRGLVPAGTRLLALDVGSKTIGLAVCDASWSIATPLRTIERTRLARDLEALRAAAIEREAGGLVVGLPVEMDGGEGRRCQSVRQFVRDLQRVLDLPVLLWDERLSTAAVTRTLIGEADLSRKRRRQVVDRAAAAWILQGALDALRHAARAQPNDPDSGEDRGR